MTGAAVTYAGETIWLSKRNEGNLNIFDEKIRNIWSKEDRRKCVQKAYEL